MNYPHWQLAIPGGMLIALVAVLHVFVSHFAVGGGFFLAIVHAVNLGPLRPWIVGGALHGRLGQDFELDQAATAVAKGGADAIGHRQNAPCRVTTCFSVIAMIFKSSHTSKQHGFACP